MLPSDPGSGLQSVSSSSHSRQASQASLNYLMEAVSSQTCLCAFVETGKDHPSNCCSRAQKCINIISCWCMNISFNWNKRQQNQQKKKKKKRKPTPRMKVQNAYLCLFWHECAFMTSGAVEKIYSMVCYTQLCPFSGFPFHYTTTQHSPCYSTLCPSPLQRY